MQFITGLHALQCPCTLNTPGDTRHASVDWTYPALADTETAFFGDYGVETDKEVARLSGTRNVANHLRAVLDLLYEGKFKDLAGLFHSVLFREAEVNRMVKIELRAFLAKLHPEELWFLKEIDHYPSDQVLEEDYKKLYALLKIS